MDFWFAGCTRFWFAFGFVVLLVIVFVRLLATGVCFVCLCWCLLFCGWDCYFVWGCWLRWFWLAGWFGLIVLFVLFSCGLIAVVVNLWWFGFVLGLSVLR